MKAALLSLVLVLSACASGTDVGNAGSFEILGDSSAPPTALSLSATSLTEAKLYVSQVTFITSSSSCATASQSTGNYYVKPINQELNLLASSGLSIDISDLDQSLKYCQLWIYTAPSETGSHIGTSLYFSGTTVGSNSFTVTSSSRNLFRFVSPEGMTISEVAKNFEAVFYLGNLISDVDLDSIASGGAVSLTPASASLFEDFLTTLIGSVVGFRTSVVNGSISRPRSEEVLEGAPSLGFDP